jgi:hypothetical protein
MQVRAMRQREAQQLRVVELDAEVLGERLAGPALVGGQSRDRRAFGSGEQALEPRPEAARGLGL